MISKSRRDSVGGGGIIAEFFRVLPMPGSVGGGGVVPEFFRHLQLRNQLFTPHSVIFVGRDTHFA